MSAPDHLGDEALDGLLAGTPSAEAIGTPLATYLAAIRHDAETTTAQPSEALQAVLVDGLAPAEVGAGGTMTSSAEERPRRGGLTWGVGSRALARVLVAKFAALGLLGKAAVAGAAVTVAASSAGAAGVLPDPAQHAFDGAVGRRTADVPVDPDVAPGDVDEGPDAPPTTRDPAATTPPLDTDVPDDATGSADGEPGVDGGDIAEDASDGRSVAGEQDRDRGAAPHDTPAPQGRDEEPVRGTPGETPPAPDAPVERSRAQGAHDEAPSTNDSSTQERRDDGRRPVTANQGDAEQEPGTGSAAGDGGGLRN